LQKIPSVNWLIENLKKKFPDTQAVYLQRFVAAALQELREKPRKYGLPERDKETFRKYYLERLKLEFAELLSGSLQPVINASGVALHTGLGRAPINAEILRAAATVSRYASLEIDLNSGRRGQRNRHVDKLLSILTGAEDGVAVNNNAAAVLLMLNTVGRGKEVILSRGEMVEIGGSFRLPEVMRLSGCKLREIGTTNKTHLRDYAEALNPKTGAILICHTSNYEIKGFTARPNIKDILALAQRNAIPVLYDLGSGSLLDTRLFGSDSEPVVSKIIAAGVDLVSFSGDKLLGGPQAGIIVGKRKWVQKCASNHLLRALRLDKLILKTLQEVLLFYLGNPLRLETLQALTVDAQVLKKRCRNLAKRLVTLPAQISVVRAQGKVGSGAYPTLPLASFALRIVPEKMRVNRLAQKLRLWKPAVIGYVSDEALMMDLRMVSSAEEEKIVTALKEIMANATRT